MIWITLISISFIPVGFLTCHQIIRYRTSGCFLLVSHSASRSWTTFGICRAHVNTYLKIGGGMSDIQPPKRDRVMEFWYTAEGLLKVGEVEGINHGAWVCAMRVHLEKEIGGFGGGPSLLIQWFSWEIVKLGHFPDRAICLSVALFLPHSSHSCQSHAPFLFCPLSHRSALIHFLKTHAVSVTT